ncbi:hypothetical protein [Prosthecobacter sp.]|uniref:hypothetical protein n=1 Tax=Prosthecobacter sp. TaxID=1965333 RepID=UPI00378497A7
MVEPAVDGLLADFFRAAFEGRFERGTKGLAGGFAGRGVGQGLGSAREDIAERGADNAGGDGGARSGFMGLFGIHSLVDVMLVEVGVGAACALDEGGGGIDAACDFGGVCGLVQKVGGLCDFGAVSQESDDFAGGAEAAAGGGCGGESGCGAGEAADDVVQEAVAAGVLEGV